MLIELLKALQKAYLEMYDSHLINLAGIRDWSDNDT